MVAFKEDKIVMGFNLDLMWIAALIEAELLRLLLTSMGATTVAGYHPPLGLTPGMLGGVAILFPVIGITLYRVGWGTLWGRVLLAAHFISGAAIALGVLGSLDGDRMMFSGLRLGLFALVSLALRSRGNKPGETLEDEAGNDLEALAYNHSWVSTVLGFSYLIIGVALLRILHLVMTTAGSLSPFGPDWLMEGLIMGEVLLFPALAVLGYLCGKHQRWVRGLLGVNLLMGVSVVAFFQRGFEIEGESVFLGLWTAIFVILAFMGEGKSKFEVISKQPLRQEPAV